MSLDGAAEHEEIAFTAYALLLAPAPARLKEWAYARFARTLASALIAHLVGRG